MPLLGSQFSLVKFRCCIELKTVHFYKKQVFPVIGRLPSLEFRNQFCYTQNIHRSFDVVDQHDQTMLPIYFLQTSQIGVVIAPLPLDRSKDMLPALVGQAIDLLPFPV